MKCCLPNGIPMTVMQSRVPKKMWHSQAQKPPKMHQIMFIGVLMHPEGLSVFLASAPKGHRHIRPILSVCSAKGIPIIVTKRARLPVK